MIKSKLNVKNILVILFSLAILLLLINVILSAIFSANEPLNHQILNVVQIENKLKESLYSYAIKDEWISKIKTSSSVPSYRIKIPADLPIPQILNELSKQYYNYNIFVRSEEKKINGRTIVNLIEDDKVILSADLRYTDGIERNSSKCAIFIFGREDKQNEYDSLLNNTTRDVSALLIPSKSNAAYTKWLLQNGFEYAVFFNNQINDIEFRMEKDHSLSRVKLIVQNVVVSFPNAIFFVVDKNSDLYKSANYEIVKNEFDKRKINFFTSDSLNFISGSTNSAERFVNLVVNNNTKSKRRIALPLEVYKALSDEIVKLVRIGYKFVRNSEL